MRAVATIEQMDVLIVEDDVSLSDALIRAVRAKELSVDFAGNAVEARRLLSRKDYKVAVVDLILPEESGFEVLAFIKDEKIANLSVIVITAADPATLGRLDRDIVTTVLFKPLNIDQLAAYVHILATR